MSGPIEAVLVVCASCGAAVPAASGSEPRCLSCGAVATLPDDQRLVHETSQQHEELSAEAFELGQRIGETPSPGLRALTVFESSCAFVLLLPVLLVVGFFVARAALVRIGDLLGRQLAEDDRYLAVGSFAFMTAVFGFGVLGATYAGRRVAGLRELQAGLSAKLPTSPGGPSCCRLCGADLAFAPSARAARCRYCAAENLVAVDPKWIGRARKASEQLASGLSEAWQAHRKEEERLRRTFRNRAIAVGIVGGGFLLLTGALIFSSPARVPETPYDRWAREAVTPRFIIERAYVGRGSDAGLSPLLSRSACDRPGRGIVKTFRFAPSVCQTGAQCNAPWFVALRAGDVIRLETSSEPSGLVLFFPQSDEPPFSKSGRGALIGKGTVAPGSHVELEAPRDGWYLLIYVIEEASPAVDYDLCAHLVRK